MTIHQERVTAFILLTFFVWCLFQFHKAQEAKKRNAWMINALVESALMNQAASEAHEIAKAKTREVFGYAASS